MALKFNGTEITNLFINGVEQKSLRYNGTGYFGKRYSLTKNTSTGVTLTVTRTSSPNQRAVMGSISVGSAIYYGDVITISVAAMTDYKNPKLYVDTGDGNGLIERSSPFTLTITNNVIYCGTAIVDNEWQTIWTGSQTFSSTGSFTVPGLESGGSVQVTANVDFEEYYIESEESGYLGNVFSSGINRGTLPTTIYGNLSSVALSRSGSQILFTFNEGEEYSKGFLIYEVPVTINITEVRRKA